MKRILVTLVSVGLLAFGVPARASDVSITFRVDLLGAKPDFRHCSLEVARGSDGIEVLQAAVAQGCITNYQLSDSPYPPPGPWSGWPPYPEDRHWLRCIDAICDAHALPGWTVPGTHWDVVWTGGGLRDYRDWGLEQYKASPGHAFVADLGGYS